MGVERNAKLFRNGRSQAVRIPKELELPGKDVVIRKEGERLIIEPKRQERTYKELVDYLRSLPPLGPEDSFPEIDDPPPDPVNF